MRPTPVPYCGLPPAPGDLAGTWNLDPWLLLALAVGMLASTQKGVNTRAMVAGMAVIVILFVSPLCALGSALFSARSAHHLLLSAMAAPLIAQALPRGGRQLAVWTLLQVTIFCAWYVPSAYALTLASDPAYWAMQTSLLVSATGFWRAVRNASAPASIAALLATMMLMGLLGALLTFATVPLYAWHQSTAWVWGLTPLEDQQLAGLIVWVLGGGLYLAAALRLVSRGIGPRELAPA